MEPKGSLLLVIFLVKTFFPLKQNHRGKNTFLLLVMRFAMPVQNTWKYGSHSWSWGKSLRTKAVMSRRERMERPWVLLCHLNYDEACNHLPPNFCYEIIQRKPCFESVCHSKERSVDQLYQNNLQCVKTAKSWLPFQKYWIRIFILIRSPIPV